MKTTVEISDPLFHQAKALAAKNGITFRDLVEDGLFLAIHARTQASEKPFRLEDGSFKECQGLQPGVEAKDMIALSYDEENRFRR
jgi:hypothetical protein